MTTCTGKALRMLGTLAGRPTERKVGKLPAFRTQPVQRPPLRSDLDRGSLDFNEHVRLERRNDLDQRR